MIGWGSIAASEIKAGKATMIGDPTKGCSSDSKLVESDTTWPGWDSFERCLGNLALVQVVVVGGFLK